MVNKPSPWGQARELPQKILGLIGSYVLRRLLDIQTPRNICLYKYIYTFLYTDTQTYMYIYKYIYKYVYPDTQTYMYI